MSKKLLLADDSVTIQKVVGITFSGGQYALTAVGDGDSALEKARIERPDLILADVCMPGKDGYELCAAIKEDSALRGIPVLLLTGTFEPFDESKATRAGADGWVAKPFESQTLIKKVDELLVRAAEAAAPVEAGIEVEETSPAGKPVRDIWADLADLDFSEEAQSPTELPEALPALGKSREDDDYFADEDGQDAPIEFPGFEEEEAFEVDGGGEPEILAQEDMGVGSDPESDEAADIWDIDSEDDGEILLLDECDIIEDEAVQDQLVSTHFLEETVEMTAPEALMEPEEDLAPEWLQTEPVASDLELSPPAEPPLVEGEDDLLADDYEEFSLEGFEDPEVDELDLSEFELEPDESIEPMGESRSPAASQDDPFQIGADDFWTEQTVSAQSQDDSAWDGGKEIPEDTVSPALSATTPSPARLTSVEEKVSALSEEEIARIVERVAGSVIERLAHTMLERIAWEVVPDLAEVMIKDEIRKIREEVK